MINSDDDTKRKAKTPAAPEHRAIMAAFDAAREADRQNIEDAESDLKFIAGDQWPEAARKEREAAGRPVFTINRLPQFIRQVTGDMRQSRPQINANPVDNEGDKKKAWVTNGLIRQVERQSNADMVYTNAFDGAVGCGIGHFRITHEYVEDSTSEQDIFIRRIANPLAVLWDPNATELDRSDAKYCFVLESLSKAAFKEKYPNAREEAFPDATTQGSDLFWQTDDSIQVAEYWYRVPAKKMLARLASGKTIDITDSPDIAADDPIVHQREADTFKVYSCIVNGSEVLSGPHEFPSHMIPIVSTIGEEVPVGKRRVRSGLVRHAKDSQRLYNFWRSAAAESIGQAPKAPFLVTENQIKSYRNLWDIANVTSSPYLIYSHDPAAPGAPQRVAPPAPPAAMWQEAQITAEEMKATTGIYDAALGAKSNETSGRAILARQREGDTSTFHYHDNLAHALRRAGQIIVSMIPRIYDTERVVRLLNADGSEQWERINARGFDERGNPIVINDVSSGRMDITINTGPSATTQRMEAANAMVEFVRAFPAAAPVLGGPIAKLMDWPGSDDVAARLNALIPPEIKSVIDAEVAKSEQGSGGQPQAMGQNALVPQAPMQPDPAQMQAMQMQAMQEQQAQQAATEAEMQAAAAAAKMEAEVREKQAKAAVAEQEAARKIAIMQMETEAERERLQMALTKERLLLESSLARKALDEQPASPVVMEQQAEPLQEAAPDMATMAALTALDRINEALQVLAAPKRVVRDASGSIIGVEPAGLQ